MGNKGRIQSGGGSERISRREADFLLVRRRLDPAAQRPAPPATRVSDQAALRPLVSSLALVSFCLILHPLGLISFSLADPLITQPERAPNQGTGLQNQMCFVLLCCGRKPICKLLLLRFFGNSAIGGPVKATWLVLQILGVTC